MDAAAVGKFIAAVAVLAGLSVTAAGQPPTLSTPVFLPGDLVADAAAGDQAQPALATAGDGVTLVAWTDWRADRTGKQEIDQTGSDIYAARIAADGSLLDALPIAIDRSAASQDRPQVSWNGQDWLVTWHTQAPTAFYWAAAVRGVRVSPSGQVLDATPLDIVTYASSSGAIHAVGTDGTDWLVAAQGTSAGEEDIVVRRVVANGSLPQPAKKLFDASVLYHGFALGRAAGVNLLAIHSSTAILSLRFDDTLNKLDPAPNTVAAGSSANAVDVASNGVECLVVWGRTSPGEVRAARITPAGQVLVPGGTQIAQGPNLSNTNVGAAWDGGQWIVSWNLDLFGGAGDLLVCRMAAGGQVLDVGGVSVLPHPQADPSGAVIAGRPAGGTRVAWTDRRVGGEFPEDVRSFTMDAALQATADLVVSQSAPRQTGACVVAYDQGYVVYFRAEASGSARLLGQRLDTSGAPVDLQPFTIRGPVSSLGPPRAARSGNTFMVTWAEGGQQFVRRVGADGAPIDPTPIFVQPVCQDGVDVAPSSGGFLAIGVDNPTHPLLQEVFGVRITGTGVPLDSNPILIGASFARRPRVAELGSRWLVTWTRNSSSSSSLARVASAWVDPSGTVLPNQDLSPSKNGLRDGDLTVAGATGYVVWSHFVAGDLDLHGTRVDLNGAPLDPGGTPIFTAPGLQRGAAVGRTASGFVALCEDQRSGTFFLDDRTDLYGGRVDIAGTAIDPGGFPVLADEVPVVEPSVAGSGARAVLAFSQFSPDSPHAAYRLAVRVLDACPGGGTTSGAGCPGSGGFVPSLTYSGCPSPGESAAIVLEDGVGGAPAFLVFGQTLATAPIGFGCDLFVAPLLPFSVPLSLSPGGAGAGAATLPFVTPAGLVGLLHIQALVADPGAAGGFTVSNALSLQFQ